MEKSQLKENGGFLKRDPDLYDKKSTFFIHTIESTYPEIIPWINY